MLHTTGMLMKTEAVDLFEADAIKSMRENFGVYLSFIDMFAPCVVGDNVWNAKPNPLDKVVREGARLDTVLTVSDEAFILLCFKNYSAKWKAEAELEINARKQRKKNKKVSFVWTIYVFVDVTTTNSSPPLRCNYPLMPPEI